jgi:hypothetical protein
VEEVLEVEAGGEVLQVDVVLGEEDEVHLPGFLVVEEVDLEEVEEVHLREGEVVSEAVHLVVGEGDSCIVELLLIKYSYLFKYYVDFLCIYHSISWS